MEGIITSMKSMSELAHDFLLDVLHEQAICVDATLGLGRDSRFFLDHRAAHVFAYEVQPELYAASCEKMTGPRITAWLRSHEFMKEDLSEYEGQIDAVIFNFGYDPHCLHGVSTLPESSVKAVNAAADLLRPKGRMALVFYPLAPGDRERKAVMESLLLRDDLELLECRRPDREACPVLLCVIKRFSKSACRPDV